MHLGSFPVRLDITGKVVKKSAYPVAGGSYADVFQGEYQGALVAIKSPRIVNTTSEKLTKVRIAFWAVFSAFRDSRCLFSAIESGNGDMGTGQAPACHRPPGVLYRYGACALLCFSLAREWHGNQFHCKESRC